jgi:peptidyl-prolyl cis-trans isomerase SDCCAG10
VPVRHRDMDNLDDYVVLDPLLEKGKGKWSKAAQAERKRGNEWAGRANL